MIKSRKSKGYAIADTDCIHIFWCLFRLECEELRSTMSKRNTDMVCRERDAQLREKEFIREQEHEGETRVLLLLNASEWVP